MLESDSNVDLMARMRWTRRELEFLCRYLLQVKSLQDLQARQHRLHLSEGTTDSKRAHGSLVIHRPQIQLWGYEIRHSYSSHRRFPVLRPCFKITI